MKVNKLIINKKYYSTSIKDIVTLISINEIHNNDAVVTVLYHGNLYINTTLQLKEV